MKKDEYYGKTTFFIDRKVVSDKPSPDMERHYHNLFEIYFIINGTCDYFIDNRTYSLEPGDLALIPSGVIHNTKYKTPEHSRFLINCSQRYIPAAVLPILPQMLYLYRNPNITGEIKEILLKIEEEYKKTDSMHVDILCCYTHMLFFLLARNMKSCTRVTTERDYIGKAIDYLQNNFTSDVSLSQVAEMCSVTPVHFSRMFKKETGFGFSEYLNILRLQKGETLLLQGENKSIAQIADECGFADSNYFSIKFKKMYGTSPKTFKKKSYK